MSRVHAPLPTSRSSPSDPALSALPGRRTSDALGAVVVLLAGPVLLLASGTMAQAPAGAPGTDLQLALGLACGTVGCALTLWALVGLAGIMISAAGRRTGRTAWVVLGERLTPAVLGRAAAALLGAQLAAAPGAWAGEGEAPPLTPLSASWTAGAARVLEPADRTAPGRGTLGPDASWTPRVPAPPPHGASSRARPDDAGDSVTVTAGDCLWDIAAAELGPDATPREIDRRWRDWHRANRDVIGEDPSILLPGTVLRVPSYLPYLPDIRGGA